MAQDKDIDQFLTGDGVEAYFVPITLPEAAAEAFRAAS